MRGKVESEGAAVPGCYATTTVVRQKPSQEGENKGTATPHTSLSVILLLLVEKHMWDYY